MSEILIIPAPAKINVCLHITGKYDNGFHALESLAVFTEFGDIVTLRHAPSFSLQISGPFAHHLERNAHDNLVVRAAQKLQQTIEAPYAAQITLHKNIPVGAGLGGGSADAAAVLRGLPELWRLPVPAETLYNIALQLGSDVPACIASRPVWMSGVGDQLDPVPLSAQGGIVLLNPNKPLLTQQVYGHYAPPFSPMPTAMGPISSMEQLANWAAMQHNALTIPATTSMPEITAVLNALKHTPGCLLSRMSGSGATCFGLYPTQQLAQAAATHLAAQQPDWWVQSTQIVKGKLRGKTQ